MCCVGWVVCGYMGSAVVVLYVINYTHLYHHIVVLDKYTHSNLVYYKHNADDELYTNLCMKLVSY